MTGMNFEYDFKGGNTRFFYRAQPEEVLDKKVWDILTKGTLKHFLLPVKVTRENGRLLFTYNIAGTINMMAWISEAPLEKKREMNQKIKYVMGLFEKMGIPKQEIISETQSMYVDISAEEIKMVCLPLKIGSSEQRRQSRQPERENRQPKREKSYKTEPMIPPAPGEEFLDIDSGREEKRTGKKKTVFKNLLQRKNKKEKISDEMPLEPEDVWDDDINVPDFDYDQNDEDVFMPSEEPEFREKNFNQYQEMDYEENQKEEADMEQYSYDLSENDRKTDFASDQDLDFGYGPGNEYDSENEYNRKNESYINQNKDFKDKYEKKFDSIPANLDEEDDDEGSDGTVILRDDGNEGTVLLKARMKPDAVLIRVQTQERFRITTENCKIGKRALMVDICIRNNPTISREHCEIHFKEGEYYLEDKDSSNYTYLNGNRAQPGEELLLDDGDQIRISDEEFIFQKGDKK